MSLSPRRRAVWAPLLALAMLVGGCAGSDGSTSTAATSTTAATTTTAPSTTTPPESTTTETPPPESSTSTTAESTTSTEAPPPLEGDPSMVLTQIVFGGVRYVMITNVGQGVGNLRGHWLCQRPGYFELPDAELAPGESAAVVIAGGELPDLIGVAHYIDAGRALGSLDPLAGEMALYTSADFSDPDAILGYVRWGESAPAGRADTAIAAGVWEADSTVVTSSDVLAITVSNLPAVRAEDWATDVGV